MFNPGTRVEVIKESPDWDSSIFEGLTGTIVEQPKDALPYETDWPWVKLDKLPEALPEKHSKIMMFNPKSLKVIDE